METDPIPFETFASFERITAETPLLYARPPAWAAAAHAIVVDEQVHYLWAEKKAEDCWVLMHSWAPTSDPTAVCHDPRNPIVGPAKEGLIVAMWNTPFRFTTPQTAATTCLSGQSDNAAL